MKDYCLFWKPIRPGQIFAYADVSETIHVPFFLSGNNLSNGTPSRSITIDPEALLYGILYGISDLAPTVDKSLSSSYFPKALERLAPVLGMPDVETLILTAGANIRQEFGSALSAVMLENGLQILPDSDKVRSDYIFDIWVAAEQREEPNHIAVMQTITAMLNEINVKSLAPPFRKCLSYVATVAFLETDPSMESTFIKENFNKDDLDWTPGEKQQIADYKDSRKFSWSALSFIE